MKAQLSLRAGPVCGLGSLDSRSLAQAIADRVARAPEGRFWSFREAERPRSRTYQEMWRRSGQMAAAIAARALPRASVIALLIGDGAEFISAFWACLRAGHIALPLTSIAAEHQRGRHPALLARLLAAAEPALVIADRHLAAAVPSSLRCTCIAVDGLECSAPLAEDAEPAELACLLPTSGSTGITKLVAISGRAMLHRCFTTLHEATQDRGAYINTFPIDSTTGVRCVSLNYREYGQLPMDVVARAPTVLLDAVEMLRASSFSLTNTVAELIMNAAASAGKEWDLSSLRLVATGSETVLPSTARRFDQLLRRFGAPAAIIRAGYGTTETGLLVTGADPLSADLAGSGSAPLGTAAPNVEIRVTGQAGDLLQEGAVGEIQVRTPLKMFSAYWGDPGAAERGFTADGWWRTGDTGLLWGGSLAIKGRTKELFVFNGRKHALSAIDDAMRDSLGQGESAFACTVPSDGRGAEGLGVALVIPPGRLAAAATAARQAVARAFGLPVAVIRSVPASAVPLTSTGKVKRAELAALLSEAEPPPHGDADARARAGAPTPAGSVISQIWEAVLGSGSARDLSADFFALGGDSLRAADLLAQVERHADVKVDPKRFLTSPTLATLLDLAEAAPCSPAEAGLAASEIWPLTAEQYRRQLVFLHFWRGKRLTANRLVLGFNTAGRKPPIVLICQGEHEARDLALHLGPDQPVFGLRSGSHIIERSDGEVQAFALRYVADVQALLPEGPILLAGVCQGGMIALAMAQHLLRRRRHVPLLALMEWPALLQPYPGRVLFLFAATSDFMGPYRKFLEPERAWRRHHAEVEVVAVPGDHLDYLKPDNMPRTAAILAERFALALHRPAIHLADEHCRVELRLGPVPPRVEVGRTFAVDVRVMNASATPWRETERSDLMLGYRWVTAAGEAVDPCCGRSPLPAMMPGVPKSLELIVTAPTSAGRATLIVDIVEEGNAWFGPRSAQRPVLAIVDVQATGGAGRAAEDVDRTRTRSDVPDHLCSSPTDTHRIEPSSIIEGEGLIWRVVMPPRFCPGDTMTDHGASALDLWEDDRPIGPAHTIHGEIREWGAGAYSHWNDVLYFSTSDGTDPRCSGRIYTFRAPVKNHEPSVDASDGRFQQHGTPS